MERLRAIPQRVIACARARPSPCPYCGGGILHRHGEVSKRVNDIYVNEVTTMRYLCVGCNRAFKRLTAMDVASGMRYACAEEYGAASSQGERLGRMEVAAAKAA